MILTDNFNEFSNIQWKDKIVQIVGAVIILFGCFVFGVFEIIYCCEKHRIVSPKVHFWGFIAYITVVGAFFSYHVVSYINTLKNDYSYYNCRAPITNEIIKKGNENNKKIIIYNKITTFTDGIIWNR